MDQDPVDSILSFWFGELSGPTDYPTDRKKLWWLGGAEEDAKIRDRFGGFVKRACAGQLGDWTHDARGTLALVLTLDQFTRSMYRGSAEAFSGDKRAQELTLEAVRRGLDQALRPIERSFLYMP
ncbi:MAG: DUF924 family protein, partial [Myxococcota bacterium]